MKNKGTGKQAVWVFMICLVMALICFVVFGVVFFASSSGTEAAEKSAFYISEICVFVGIFFLVIGFGYGLPNVIKSRRNANGIQEDATDIFNEKNMHKALERYTPDGEAVLAGIHVVTKESFVSCAFEECAITEDRLIPEKNNNIVTVSKKKLCTYDMYLGITKHFLVVADCEENRYYYEFDEEADKNKTDIHKVTEDILFKDIGKCFSLDAIESCKMKNGFCGSVNCDIRMKNGGYLKIMIPATGGLTAGMPNHKRYRDEIMECLSKI